MNAQRLQGTLFCLLALPMAPAASAVSHSAPQIELIVPAVLIAVFGIPHGALDPIFANRLYGIHSFRDWLRFGVIYLLLGASVVAFWMLAPLWFLIGFLVISVLHFSGDPAEGTPAVSRLLYAGAIIILPGFRHQGEMARLFGQLIGTDPAQAVSAGLAWLAWPWAIGLVLAALERWHRDRLTALEMIFTGLLAVLFPPLVSFTLYFCGMHSARHIIRTAAYAGRSPLRVLMSAALLPLAGTGLLAVVAWHFLKDTPADARVLQIVFVGLAALTVPHMLLVERVRRCGWSKVPLSPC